MIMSYVSYFDGLFFPLLVLYQCEWFIYFVIYSKKEGRRIVRVISLIPTTLVYMHMHVFNNETQLSHLT